jgi:hypothetical protein
MFATCKGLHCAGCKPQFSFLPLLIIVILCLKFQRTIGVILTDVIIGAAVFTGALMVMSMIVYAVMMRVLMPKGSTRNAIIYTSHPAQFFGAVEAHSGYKGDSEKGLDITTPVPIHVQSSIQVLSRPPYERGSNRQFQLPKGRDSR